MTYLHLRYVYDAMLLLCCNLYLSYNAVLLNFLCLDLILSYYADMTYRTSVRTGSVGPRH